MCKSLLVLVLLLTCVAHVEARYCSSPNCAMCNRLFGYLPGSAPQRLTAIDSTPHDVVKVMIAALNLTSKDLLYDLGCGDGRALIEAVRQSGCRAVGIEIDARVAATARANVRKSGVGDRIRITTGDVQRYNLSQATAVFLYLNPPLIMNILPKIKTNRIVSYQHSLPGIPCRLIKAPNGAPIYCSHETQYGKWW